MLGDSIVFGWGDAAQDTMPAHLERDLDVGGAFGHAQVINSGVGNYNTAMEVEYFLKSGADYKPDIIVLGYFINDAEPTPTYKPAPWIARNSYAYAITGGAWDTFKRMILGGPEWKAYYTGLYDETAPGWNAAQDAVKRLAAYCRDHNIRLVLANIPELRELKPYPFTAVNQRIAALAAENGVEYLDLLPALQDQEPSSLWVTRPDPHPNAKAQALMARRIADYLIASARPPV
jgi:lysophospholipase L1-like esterase